MIRKARIGDVRKMQKLINEFARKDRMLPKSLNELYDNIRDFWVVEDRGVFIGCAALHVCWDVLAEIKSVAVVRGRQKKGWGQALVKACLDEAANLGITKVFVLTYSPDFFKRFGFKRIEHSELPHKIWAECIHCCKFPDCREIAMLKTV